MRAARQSPAERFTRLETVMPLGEAEGRYSRLRRPKRLVARSDRSAVPVPTIRRSRGGDRHKLFVRWIAKRNAPAVQGDGTQPLVVVLRAKGMLPP